MKSIRAFVGHSFNEADEALIRKFLDFFSTLQGSMDFMWEHAENAAPEEVANKVKRIIKDKNTFIGICTIKELVLPDNIKGYLSKIKYLYSASQMVYKTSDWIIQEIGLAIGRDMKIILLIEAGVKPPLDLLGNTEYIQFSRSRPEAAFQKIVQMLSSLSSLTRDDAETPDSETSEDIPKRSEVKATTSSDNDAASENEDDRLKMQYIQSSYAGNREKATSAKREIEAYYKSRPKDEIAEMHAFCECVAIDTGTGGTIQELERLCKENPKSTECKRFLALALTRLAMHDRARDEYEKIYEIEESKEQRREALIALGRMAVSSIQHDREYPTALIESMRERVDVETEALFLDDFNEILKVSERPNARMAVLERLIRIRPDDPDISFEAAYLYSKKKLHELCFLHYNRRSDNLKGANEWNNLGVVSAQLGLKIKSTEAYRSAAEKHNSLAAANLAYQYFSLGFLEDGIALLEKARNSETVHPNVYEALASVEIRREDESRKIDDLTRNTRKISNFVSDIGRAVSRSRAKLLNPNWRGPACALSLREGQIFLLEGQAKSSSDSTTSSDKPLRIRYEGSWEGCAVFGKVKRTPAAPPTSPPGLLASAFGSMLSDMPTEEEFIGFLEADHLTIMISEKKNSGFGDPYKIQVSENAVISGL